MLASGFVRLSRSLGWVALALLLAAIAPARPARAQEVSPPEALDAELEADDPSSLDAIEDPEDEPRAIRSSGVLSMEGGQQLLSEAGSAIEAQNYPLAQQRLEQARRIFNQLSNFHQQLASSFTGIDNRISQEQRRSALEAAQLRDRATYQLALVHRAQNRPELAVPLLVQIVRSQNPTRDLGQRAFQQLVELGFVSSTTPRPAVGADREPGEAPEGGDAAPE